MAGHPQAGKLRLTAELPRTPGVYLFCGHRDEVLYVGKATNLRQRVRSYFGRDDRRRIGPMLREMQAVRHHCLPDPLSAEVIEARLIARCSLATTGPAPAPTSTATCASTSSRRGRAWRSSRSRRARGVHLGPLPSRTMAGLVVEALQSALPLRRCSVRLGRSHVPAPRRRAVQRRPSWASPHARAPGLADRRGYDRRRRCRRRRPSRARRRRRRAARQPG